MFYSGWTNMKRYRETLRNRETLQKGCNSSSFLYSIDKLKTFSCINHRRPSREIFKRQNFSDSKTLIGGI